MKQKKLNQDTVLISAYAPTPPASKKDLEIGEKFYEELEALIKSVSNRTILLIGDFNAQTRSGFRQYGKNMGRYGKGKINSNAVELMETCYRNDLVLINAFLCHQLSHTTTWQAPYRECNSMKRRGSPSEHRKTII